MKTEVGNGKEFFATPEKAKEYLDAELPRMVDAVRWVGLEEAIRVMGLTEEEEERFRAWIEDLI